MTHNASQLELEMFPEAAISKSTQLIAGQEPKWYLTKAAMFPLNLHFSKLNIQR